MKRVPILAAVVCLGFYLPVALSSERIIYQLDYWYYQVPVRQFIREELCAGRFPLWIPHIGCGTPLHAAQQAAICYPLLTPLLFFFPADVAVRLGLFLHAGLGFVGQYLLARRFGCSASASALGALWLVCGGFLVAHLAAGHVNLVLEASLLPWFFLALLWLLREPGPWSASALAVLVTLLVFLGHPQVPLYALLFGFLWMVGSLLRGNAARHRGKVILWSSAAGLLAGLLSLVQVLPVLELYRDGLALNERVQWNTENRNFLAVRWIDLLAFVLPNATGNPYADIPVFRSYPSHYHERAAYLGLAPLLLAALALSRGRRERWQWGCVALCLLGVIIALADQTPLFSALCRIVPGLGMFRCPGRVFGVSSVLFVLLAARGLDVFLGEKPEQRHRLTESLPIAMLGLALTAAVIWFGQPFWELYRDYVTHHLITQCLATMFFLALTVVVFILGRRVRVENPQLACTLVLLVSFSDLWYFQLRHFQLVAPEPSILPAGTPDRPRLAVDSTDFYTWHYSELVRPAIERHGSTAATNEGGVQPRALERLYRAFLNPNFQPAALALSSSDLILDPDTSTWTPADDSLPRIRFCQGSEVLDPLPEHSSRRVEARDLETPGTGCAVVLGENPQYLALAATVTQPEWLVVADTYYPGWECQVDGAEVPIEAAHGCFRAVHLEPGKHHVEFRYRPHSFHVGLFGSAMGVVLLAGMLRLGCWLQRKS
jgi:hypothetical protein